MPPENKLKIDTLVLVIDAERHEIKPHDLRLDPNSESWPDHWTITHNAYTGATLTIYG